MNFLFFMKNGHIAKKSVWSIPPKTTHSEFSETVSFPIPQGSTPLLIQTHAPFFFLSVQDYATKAPLTVQG